MYRCLCVSLITRRRLRWDCLFNILDEMGVPKHLIYLISNLYMDGKNVVRVNDVISNPFRRKKRPTGMFFVSFVI